MKTIAHLSDLHFGTEDPAVAEGLRVDVRTVAPTLVVVSGDLTQRARRAQFEQAHNYLERLPKPQLVIPGNHDIPLYDLLRRFGSPLGRYRQMISDDVNPVYRDEDLVVIGVNTARGTTWKSGRISPDQLQRVRVELENSGRRLKVVVTHHPFIPPPVAEGAGIDFSGAENALTIIAAGGADLLLAGHLHHGYVGDTRAQYPLARRSVVGAQAGTGISRRVRNEPNAYNLITLTHECISVQIRAWNGQRFTGVKTVDYFPGPLGWELAKTSART